MLALHDLVKVYGTLRAVDGVDLEVRPGEVVALLGPNGAGKTTTLRMIAGLVRPTSGRIVVNGLDLLQHPLEARRLTAFIPDRPYLWPKLTGAETLRLIAGLYRLDRRLAADRGAALLDTFGLAGRAGDLVETYSHGMKQRLVFAGALLHEPRLLVVDEPMVGLDPRAGRMVRGLLYNLAHDEGRAILLSTHTLEVAEEVCDRIHILHHGHVTASGTMDELRHDAHRPGSKLEEIFLTLTEEAHE
jgi:ABC-2 type transport system ATP-binding protein